ncbi:hypothetical protein FRC09_011037 [Ceratobasidium sp. 395]|nr:hypothetical protein FRC09_011037 [Ceratobasidium sp. 395]
MTSLIPAAVPVAKKAAVVPAAPKLGLNFTVVQDTILHHWDRLIEHSQAAANVSIPRPSPTNTVERIVFRLPAPSVRSLESIESRFAALGRAARLFSHAFARRWQQLAVADGTSERAFAISLGYLVLTLVMGIYLGVLNAGAVRGAARALRNAVKQQLIVIKVALFIGLELLVFPTGCGVVLDAATLPLFESATLAGRIAFYDFAPLTAFFCHWLVGTIFMYQFALTLGACRAVMRPGAMWFIKDPQDASFSPIRDILDKHVLTQLRKLAVSAVMYTLVIVVAVGSVAYTLRFAPVFSGVLPLRGNMRTGLTLFFLDPSYPTPTRVTIYAWYLPHSSGTAQSRLYLRTCRGVWGVIRRTCEIPDEMKRILSEPLSEIPVDLLFLHLVVPPTVKRLTVGGWVKARLEEWWKYTARQLRLSSFMFGKVYYDELSRESSVPRETQDPGQGWTHPGPGRMHGRWLRVPKGDNIAFLRDEPVLIEVDDSGRAVRERGREVMAAQDEETRRAGRQPEQDYTIVHVPPMFGARCMLLVALLWITAATAWRLRVRARNAAGGAGAGGAANLNPVPNPNPNPEPNANVNAPVGERDEDEPEEDDRRLEELGRAMEQEGAAIGLRDGMLRDSSAAYRGRDEIVERAHALSLVAARECIIRNGLARPDALGATRAFLGPVCGGLVLVVGAPAAGLWLLERALPGAHQWGSDALSPWITIWGFAPLGCRGDLVGDNGALTGCNIAVTVVYPGIFCGTAMVGLWRAGRRAGKRWLQGVRDEEFLVELRLRNLETERK